MKFKDLVPNSIYFIETTATCDPEYSFKGKARFTGVIELENYEYCGGIAEFDNLEGTDEPGAFSEDDIKYLVEENPIYKDFANEIIDKLKNKSYASIYAMREGLFNILVSKLKKEKWIKPN